MSPQLFLDLVGTEAAKRFRKRVLPMVDLFCGAGGISTGALIAFGELGLAVQLACVNHWDAAIATHELNHKGHLHFCTGVDKVSIEDLLCEWPSATIAASSRICDCKCQPWVH
jgi:site-specific DNA-cytosine methylase